MSRVEIAPVGGESLVHDLRLDKVFLHLSKLVKFPEGMGFAAQIQETKPLDETKKPQEVVVFYVTSIHPLAGKKPYPADAPLITMGAMSLENWLTADKEFRFYSEIRDPLRPIFAKLVREHLATRKKFEELYA